MPQLKKQLKEHFGYDAFRPHQEEIIRSILSGKDTLALLPTGGGKSLCYQLPAMMLSGITVVVSPLIALMKDQVGALKTAGLPAAYLNSSMGKKEERMVMNAIDKKEVKLLYVAPERLLKPDFLGFMAGRNISLIAIDEAHCISEWGHDFRPEYRNLYTIRKHWSGVPVVALTATATRKVRDDIVRQLAFTGHAAVTGSFNRPNLYYEIRAKDNAYYDVLDYLERNKKHTGIIYCHSRASADRLARELTSDGVDTLAYHAGLTTKERTHNQELFMKGGVRVITATIAFGMGIDKPDIRFVMHYDLPKNIEGYYQETGRAGRDGKPSHCILFYSPRDLMKHKYFIDQMMNRGRAAVCEAQLNAIATFCTSYRCRRSMMLQYFGEQSQSSNCGNCDICSPQ